jgi:predicted phage terminase large subunit-like protein
LLRTTTLPVYGVRPDKDKMTRFLPLLARYEQGLVCHAPSLPGWFEEELLTFPIGDHDDGVDAAAHAFDALPPLSTPNYAPYEPPVREFF